MTPIYEYIEMGALMTYLFTYSDQQRSVAALLDKVLRGADPARTPFEQPDARSSW
jgi:ABC-type uncharacterized transport system substrate-binding protein